MDEFDVLIIGAGASGLAAARKLCMSAKNVAVVEAQNRLGGRINSVKPEGFSVPIETGAEFIHGDLPVTLSIIKKANISFQLIEGKTYQVKNGKLHESEEFIEGFSLLISKLDQLKKDIPFGEFLNINFGDEKYKALRESVTRFAEGYDAANVNRVSSFALRDEWKNEDTSNSYRIINGYSQIINFLGEECSKSGCSFYLSTNIKTVNWSSTNVEVRDDQGQSFFAEKVLLTVPLSLLNLSMENERHISFYPDISQKLKAAEQIGFGTVIKLFFEFREAFWEEKKFKGNNIHHMPDLGFLLSDAAIPTWWTQAPDKIPILTGWLAGPGAEKLVSKSDDDLIDLGITSLAYIFDTDASFVSEQIKASYVVNWLTNPFALGAYSYPTIESKEAREILLQPVEDKLYFAGEALYEGQAMGTVEAALVSGINAANKILQK